MRGYEGAAAAGHKEFSKPGDSWYTAGRNLTAISLEQRVSYGGT